MSYQCFLLLLFQMSNKYISRIMTVHLTALSTDKNTFSQKLIQHRRYHLVIMQHLVKVSVTICGPTSLRGLSHIQLELPHKTTVNCRSLIKCVFYYWRHYLCRMSIRSLTVSAPKLFLILYDLVLCSIYL